MRMSTGQKNYTEHTGETGGDTEDGEQVVFGDGEDGVTMVTMVRMDKWSEVKESCPLSCTILWPERSRCALR